MVDSKRFDDVVFGLAVHKIADHTFETEMHATGADKRTIATVLRDCADSLDPVGAAATRIADMIVGATAMTQGDKPE